VRSPQAVLVAYRSPLWLKVAIGSFLAQFPDQEILVVDNNPRRSDPGWEPECEAERQWLADHRRVRLLPNPGADRSHGAGMDLALAWCRENGVAAMLHFEPDCYISGATWYRELVEAIGGGAWMAATHRLSWGALHPCPSIWSVADVRASFCRADGSIDVPHPRFPELVDSEAYRRKIGIDMHTTRWKWDTGQKAWFEAAIADRAVKVSRAGFAHYWRGSQTRQEDPSLFLDPRLLRYARPSPARWTRVVGRQLVRVVRRKPAVS